MGRWLSVDSPRRAGDSDRRRGMGRWLSVDSMLLAFTLLAFTLLAFTLDAFTRGDCMPAPHAPKSPPPPAPYAKDCIKLAHVRSTSAAVPAAISAAVSRSSCACAAGGAVAAPLPAIGTIAPGVMSCTLAAAAVEVMMAGVAGAA